MQKVGWRAVAFVTVVGLLGACEPPPLEVVSEQPDFASGVTVRPTDPSAPRVVSGAVLVTEALEPVDAVPVDEGFDVVVPNDGGLVERLPNTCKLENYQQFQGQNAAILAGAGLDRAYRIVGPTTIVSQEYDPARLNFSTTDSGIIQQITCG